MGLEEFVGLWGEGENSFAADPPNAVLAFLKPGDEVPEDVAVVLREPKLDGDRLTYALRAARRRAAAAGSGPCSLFIDPLGRPLSAGLGRRCASPHPPSHRSSDDALKTHAGGGQ